MPEGRVTGRSVATSIDDAEHGAMLSCVMAVRPRTPSTAHGPKPSDRELRPVRRLPIIVSTVSSTRPRPHR